MTQPHATDKFLDNTKVSAYKDCPRKYFLRHVKDWRGEGTAVPLVFGGAWHAGQDIIWKHAKNLDASTLREGAMAAFEAKWTEEGFQLDLDVDQEKAMAPRTPMIAAEMFAAYIDERWKMLQECELINVEQPFAVPLPNLPHTWYVGRLDKVVSHNGTKLVIEHKTTAIYRRDGGFDSSYITGWYSDSQIKGYQFGAGLYYPGLSQVWVDCALVHRQVHDAFRFVPVSHNFGLIREWLTDTEEWIARLARDEAIFQRDGHLTPGCFPKNENSCYGKFGGCAFLDICRTTADIPKDMAVPSGYMVEKWEPFETLGLDKIIDKE